MGYNLQYQPLDNLGINGLNTQDNPASLDTSWLTDADNIVLRESGRISFRKGLKQKVLATTAKVGSIAEDTANDKIVCSVGANVYEVDFTAPTAAFTNSFATGASDSNWQWRKFNNELYAFQSGSDPLDYDNGTFTLLKNSATYNAPSGITNFNPSCGLGYYGRIWAGGVTEKKDVVFYSDTLDGHRYNTGAAGQLDLKTVWGSDEIVAIEAFFGKLVIFGSHNIVIYNNPEDPNTMTLDEVIRGIGLASRDSVQPIGDDLIFLSHTGLRSLGRTTEKDNIPMQDYSSNIKDSLIRHLQQSTNICSVYVSNEGMYLLSFVDLNLTYVFDMKHVTPNNTPRVTTWSFTNDLGPSSFAYTESQGFLIGQEDGSISEYDGYYDVKYVSGGNHTKYSFNGKFKTTWLDLGEGSVAAILKKMTAVVNGGQGTVVGVKWYTDFSTEPRRNVSFTLNPTASGTSFLYGAAVSLYGTAKYAPSYGLKEYSVPLVGSAKYLQFELDAETKGYVASLQDMTLLYKQGKIR